MRFLVVEKVRDSALPLLMGKGGYEMRRANLEHKSSLRNAGKIVAGGPFLDVLGGCFIIDVETIEELGDILFESPENLWVEREVHPLGTFEDTLEGTREMARRRMDPNRE